jgi:4-hydroxy-3-methylbut-2-enyl diphosphate reductase
LTSLGDIVHNNEEVLRLEKKGLKTISHNEMSQLHNEKVLLRAHGEPPSTYMYLKEKGVNIIEATCPVVLKLQHNVRNSWEKMKTQNGQIVIYGKKGHPEVVGLIGQTNGEAHVISDVEDLKLLDPQRPVEIFSQTTMSNEGLIEIEQIIKKKFKNINLTVHHTICEQVANRVPHLKNFAKQFEIIIFVGGEKSSNGKMLFDICKQINQFTYYAYSNQAVEAEWFNNHPQSVGICGATSTPHWLMKKVAEKVNEIINKNLT